MIAHTYLFFGVLASSLKTIWRTRFGLTALPENVELQHRLTEQKVISASYLRYLLEVEEEKRLVTKKLLGLQIVSALKEGAPEFEKTESAAEELRSKQRVEHNIAARTATEKAIDDIRHPSPAQALNAPDHY